MKNSIVFFLIFILFNVYSANNGLYSVVSLKKNKKLLLRSEPKVFSKVIGKLDSNLDSLKTTWKTEKNGDDYWIEIDYDGLKGWVRREFVTNRDLDISNLNKESIDSIMYKFALAIQKGKFSDVSDLIYPVRGLWLYSYSVGKAGNYTFEKLNKDWGYLTDKKYTGGSSINYYLESITDFLEGKFEIDDKLLRKNEKLPNEIANFSYIKVANNKQNLYIGFELWNNKIYVSYLAVSKI